MIGQIEEEVYEYGSGKEFHRLLKIKSKNWLETLLYTWMEYVSDMIEVQLGVGEHRLLT